MDTANTKRLAHFISHSPWDEVSMIEEIQRSVVTTINPEGKEIAALIIDDSLIDADHQHGQVGVFLAYATSTRTCLMGRKLYVPGSGCKEGEAQPGQPAFKTKGELALELVDQAIAHQIAFAFIHVGFHYGKHPWFLDWLQEKKLTFIADIGKNTQVFVGMPIGVVEEIGNDQFQMVINRKGAAMARDLVAQRRVQFHKVAIEDGQRGELIVNFAALRVRRSCNNMPIPGELWLLIRQALDGSDTKFSLSNAPATTAVSTLARWQSRRYWVERSLQDAKGLVGADQSQVTGWKGWHHHTAMVMLAMLHLLTTEVAPSGLAPQLTLSDALAQLQKM